MPINLTRTADAKILTFPTRPPDVPSVSGANSFHERQRLLHVTVAFTVLAPIVWPHPAQAGDLLILYPYTRQASLITAEEKLAGSFEHRAVPFEHTVDMWRALLRMLVEGSLQSTGARPGESLMHWVREAAMGATQVRAREGAVLLLARTSLIAPVLAQPGDVVALYAEQPARLYRRFGEEWRHIATGDDHDAGGIRDLVERGALVPLSDWHASRLDDVAPYPFATLAPVLRLD